jgi:hypothetical protein
MRWDDHEWQFEGSNYHLLYLKTLPGHLPEDAGEIRDKPEPV